MLPDGASFCALYFCKSKKKKIQIYRKEKQVSTDRIHENQNKHSTLIFNDFDSILSLYLNFNMSSVEQPINDADFCVLLKKRKKTLFFYGFLFTSAGPNYFVLNS